MDVISAERRRRWPRLAIVAGTALLLMPFGVEAASATAADTPPTSCEAQWLDVPDGYGGSEVTAGSPDGRYLIGGVHTAVGDTTSVLWTDGTPKLLDTPGSNPSFHGVNDDGVAVGRDTPDAQWPSEPLVYQDGKISVLPGVNGHGEARGINSNGDIAGVLQVKLTSNPPTPPGANSFPVRWRAGQTSVEKLPVPEGTTDVYVGGITEDGTVVGVDMTAPAKPRVYAWPMTGDRYELPLPAGDLRGESVTVAGSMVAADFRTPNGWGAALWNIDDVGVPVVVSTSVEFVYGVNANGWIVGWGYSGDGEGALLASVEGGDLFLQGPAQGLSTTSTVSRDGHTLAGETPTGEDVQNAVIWTCS